MADAPVDAIKERIDIVALISESLPLKRAGSNFKARRVEELRERGERSREQIIELLRGAGSAEDALERLRRTGAMTVENPNL